jgi:hypothetical protein
MMVGPTVADSVCPNVIFGMPAKRLMGGIVSSSDELSVFVAGKKSISSLKNLINNSRV